MKIVKVEIIQLFGVFNHVIPLMTDENITIVIGENGLGKTAILEAINSLFSKNYNYFYDLVFEAFYLYFDNDEVWRLTKKNENGQSLYIGKTTVKKINHKIKEYKISSRGYSNKQLKRLHLLKNRQRYIEFQNHKNIHWEEHTYEELELLNRRAMIEEKFMYELDDNGKVKLPNWFEDGIAKINIHLIETQRIITRKENDSNSYINNVQKCSEELKQFIELATKKSSQVTLSLDSTYPNRLIKKLKQGTIESFKDLNTALAKLDIRRKSFSSTGLVFDSQDSELLQINENQEDLINTLKLYVDDSHKKLDPYDELSSKIMLLRQIVNKRFKHKRLIIDPKIGMVFLSTVKNNKKGQSEEIPSSKLSSGEQNELILFYKLIFHSKNGDMILIDEPELSLHISWQNKFIKDLKEVTSINDVSIIIATHSPDIIDENWDLKVELLGVE